MDSETNGDKDLSDIISSPDIPDIDPYLNMFKSEHVEGPTEGTQHCWVPSLCTFDQQLVEQMEKLPERPSTSTVLKNTWNLLNGDDRIIGGAGPNVTDKNVLQTSNFDQIRPGLEPSNAPIKEKLPFHLDKSTETSLRSLFEIFLNRSVKHIEFNSFLKQQSSKFTNGHEEQQLQAQNLVKQACLEFCLQILRQEYLKMPDDIAKTHYYQGIWGNFKLACRHSEVQDFQEHARKLWFKIFPEHQTTTKLPRKTNKRRHTSVENDNQPSPAPHTPSKQLNSVEDNNSPQFRLKLFILDYQIVETKGVEVETKGVEVEIKGVDLSVLIPLADKLRSITEIFMSITYSERSDSQVVFWAVTGEGQAISSIWNINHDNHQYSRNSKVRQWTIHYECQGCAKNKKNNTILVTVLIDEKKITVTKTPQTIDHDCEECFSSEDEENLKPKRKKAKSMGRIPKHLNLLTIFFQHFVMNIRTAILNGQTVTSPYELKKGEKNTNIKSAHLRLLKDCEDILPDLSYWEGKKCLPKGFAKAFENHILPLRLHRETCQELANIYQEKKLFIMETMKPMRVQTFGRAFNQLKLNAYWCNLIKAGCIKSKTIDIEYTVTEISRKLTYSKVAKAREDKERARESQEADKGSSIVDKERFNKRLKTPQELVKQAQEEIITKLRAIGWPKDMDWSNVEESILNIYEKDASLKQGKINIMLPNDFEIPVWYPTKLREVAETENSIRKHIVSILSQERTLINQDERQAFQNEFQATDRSNIFYNYQDTLGTSKQYFQI